MLISLIDLKAKYNMKITGVIHIGAHFGEEYAVYNQLGIENIHFIEPAKEAFEVLTERFAGNDKVKLYNVACGSVEGEFDLYTERRNKGQSNSLLKPKKHLDYYPDIKFAGTQRVKVVTLDSLKIEGCNMINIDVQGAEGMVFEGAIETLKGIDYIYSEVNTGELYEGCTQLFELRNLLEGFEDVEVKMTRQNWGDALFIRL